MLHNRLSKFYQLQPNHRGAMAYTHSLFTADSQTSRKHQNIAPPRDEMARNTAFRGFSRRIIFSSLAAFLVLLWIICARTKSSKQTDRIGFSHGSTREQVEALPLSENSC